MNTGPFSAARWVERMILVVLFILSLGWLLILSYQAGNTPGNIAVSAVLLAVPLGLLYFSIGVLVEAARQRRQGRVGGRLAKAIYRTPRIAGILIVLFVGMFALDVFSENASIWQQLLGFLIHALPAIILAAALALAWRWDWIGFVAFLAAAVFFSLLFLSGSRAGGLAYSLQNILIFTAPLVAIALLFLANWRWKKDLRGE